jgi:predicted lipoprotein
MPSEAEEDIALAKDLVQSAKDRLVRAAKAWRQETTMVTTRELLTAVDALTHAEQLLRDQEAWSNVH